MKSQTINLLKKELTLGNTVQSICWFICCAGMYFIPSYPSYIGPFYITLAIMMTFALNQSSHDILYTALLPVRKIDTVKARFLYCGLLEICAIAFGVIAAIIKHFVHFPENQAGINLTFAYQLKKRLVQTYGEKITYNHKAYYIHPTTEVIANVSVQELMVLKFSRRKAEYLIKVLTGLAETNTTGLFIRS